MENKTRQRSWARQRLNITHGKEAEHGKASTSCTEMKDTRQSLTTTHGKER
jgi:hypothetical protein